MKIRSILVAVLVLVSAFAVVRVVSGSFTFLGVNSITLPFSKGNGDDSYTVTVYMENVANLVPNSEVKVSEITVGSVRKIELDGWRAKLTIGLEGDVVLPANLRARVAQKSLLGAEYLELREPRKPAQERLADGAVIDLAQTSRYPETEEALSAMSLLLNGGGLAQVSTITRELNATFEGRDGDIRNFIAQLDTFVTNLDDQRDNIVLALRRMNDLGAAYAGDVEVLGKALEELPAAVELVAAQRKQLVRTLSEVGDLGDTVDGFVDKNQDLLVEATSHLTGTLKAVADAGDVLADAVEDATYPFPVRAVIAGIKGDYMNLFFTVDLSLASIERDYLSGTPLSGIYSQLLGLLPAGNSVAQGDILENPLVQDPTGADDEPKGTANDPDDTGDSDVEPDSEVPQPDEDDAPQGGLSELLQMLVGGRS